MGGRPGVPSFVRRGGGEVASQERRGGGNPQWFLPLPVLYPTWPPLTKGRDQTAVSHSLENRWNKIFAERPTENPEEPKFKGYQAAKGMWNNVS